MEDLTGVTFNDLTAVKFVGKQKGHTNVWTWVCVCGKEVDIPASKVKTGHNRSCGCLKHREKESKKICKHCGEISYRKNRHGNFASVCQKCYNRQCNSFKTRNPKKFMVQCAKVRANKAGVPFSITDEDFDIPEFCPVLGVKLESGTKKYHEASPSLDRIIPSKGYVPGNVVVMSFRANRIKGDATPEELRTIINWMDAQTRRQSLEDLDKAAPKCVCGAGIWGEGYDPETGERFWSHILDSKVEHKDGSKIGPGPYEAGA